MPQEELLSIALISDYDTLPLICKQHSVLIAQDSSQVSRKWYILWKQPMTLGLRIKKAVNPHRHRATRPWRDELQITHHTREDLGQSLHGSQGLGLPSSQTVLELVERLSDRVGVRDLGVVHEGDVPHSPTLEDRGGLPLSTTRLATMCSWTTQKEDKAFSLAKSDTSPVMSRGARVAPRSYKLRGATQEGY